MAGEIQAQRPTGETLYAILLNEAGAVWNGAAFDATPTTAEWATYDIALVEDNTTGLYRATMPSSTAGDYRYHVHKQLGGTPAPTDPLVWTGEVAWSGSVAVGISDTPTAAAIADAVFDEMLAGHSAAGSAGEALANAAAGSASAADIATELASSGYSVAVTDTITEPDLIQRRRGDTWTVTFANLGDLSDATRLYLTLKRDLDNDPDTKAVLQVRLTIPGAVGDGIQRLAGLVPEDATDGELAVTDEPTGDITLSIHGRATALLPARRVHFDIKKITDASDDPITIAAGDWNIIANATRATE